MSDANVQIATVLASDNPWGTQTGWAPQQPSKDVQKDRASSLNELGNEAVSKLFNERTEYSTPFRAQVTGSAPTIPSNIGAVLNSGAAVLLEIQIGTTQNDFASMTLSGHQHAANAHEDTLRQVAHGITLSDGFGAKDFIGLTLGSDASIASGSITISVQHEDVLDSDGDHFSGQNLNGMLSAETVFNGVPSETTASGWDVTSVVTAPNNQGVLQTTVRAQKKLTLA